MLNSLELIAAVQANPLKAALALVFACAVAWAVGKWLGGGANSAALTSASAPKAPLPAYKRAEVKAHSSKEDLWVVIGRKV